MTPEELSKPVTQLEMASIAAVTRGFPEGDIVRRMCWEIDLLRELVSRLPCAAKSHSFHHTPEQWRMCVACSARRGTDPHSSSNACSSAS